jgi:hypothetical protein
MIDIEQALEQMVASNISARERLRALEMLQKYEGSIHYTAKEPCHREVARRLPQIVRIRARLY